MLEPQVDDWGHFVTNQLQSGNTAAHKRGNLTVLDPSLPK